MADDDNGAPTQGPAVDRYGNPVLDPTKNVYSLVDAAMLRQDDLRLASEKRQDDLRNADANHARELAAVRAHHAAELRAIETARLDAIRNVDNVAVQRAAEVSATQAATLAQTLAQTAEAMRTQVAAAATVTATALDAKIAPLQNAIGDLQRFQFEAQGQKTQVVETQAITGGSRAWVGIAVALTLGLLGLFGTVLMISVAAVGIYLGNR